MTSSDARRIEREVRRIVASYDPVNVPIMLEAYFHGLHQELLAQEHESAVQAQVAAPRVTPPPIIAAEDYEAFWHAEEE